MANKCPQTGSKQNQIATTTNYQTNTTNIEEIFHYELTFIRICGGYLFEQCSLTLRILYQMSIIFMTKIFATNYYSIETKNIDPIHRASLQNVRMFRDTYLVVSVVIVIVNFFTALKYNKLLSVILKKRLDKRYLDGGFVDKQDAALSIQRAKFDKSNVTTSNGLNQTDAGEIDMKTITIVANGDKIKEIPAKKRSGFMKARHVRMVRTLLIVNVLSNSLASYLRYNSLDRPTLPGQVMSKPSANRSPGPATIESTSSTTTTTTTATATTKPSVTNDTLLTNGDPIELDPTTIMTPFERQVENSLPNSPLNLAEPTSDQKGPSLHELLMLVYRWRPFLIVAGFCSKILWKTTYQVFLQLAKLIYEFLRAALNINQNYGQIYVVLMIMATLTDMLSYSRFYDALVDDEQLNQISDIDRYHSAISGQSQATDLSKGGSNQKSNRKQSQRKKLLTNELLVQIRDVLIVVRYTSSLNYLGILIFDLTRIGSVFCQFYTAISTESLWSIVLLFIQYVLIAFSLSLTGLGYHWLHGEVRNLRRFIDERNLVRGSVAKEAGDYYYDEDSSVLKRSERITTCRLADDIGNLWPTDWFTPDFRCYLKHNILVITLVATLQQLVEAGAKIRHNGPTQNG